MKRFFILSALVLTSGILFANPYRISLLTCGPGDQLYSTFGHTALRVVDLDDGSEAVYNFGMFNFGDPNFYVKFVRGDLDYYLGIQSFDNFVREYEMEERYVYEQVLNLTALQTERIMAELDFRDLPENRSYKYKFIQRNCTTELRDIIAGAIDADEDFIYAEDANSWRGYLNSCLRESPWAKIGINIVLGSGVDRPVTNFEGMFLPRRLYKALPRMAAGSDLVAQDIVINPDTRSGNPRGFAGRNYPYILLILIAVGIIMANSRVADSIYCFAMGLLGLLIVFLMFYGTHMEFKANFNLLLFNPLLIWLGVAILRRKSIKLPAGLCGASLLALCIVWIAGVQGVEGGLVITSLPVLWICVKYLFLDKTFFRAGRYRG